MRPSKADLAPLQLVSRIALFFACAALAGVPLILTLSSAMSADTPAISHRLPLLMVLSGIPLAAVIGIGTWVIVLRGSFRFAGPLHRFCTDLELGLSRGRVPHFRVRATDAMHHEARMLEEAALNLHRHYDELAGALESAGLRVRRGRSRAAETPCPGERVHRLIAEVRL